MIRRMRALLTGSAIVIAMGVMVAAQATPPTPQTPGQQPVFRAGIELVTVDVTALDSNGRQVMDLTPTDFQVEIDGDRRQVISAEYIRLVDPLRVIGKPAPVVVADETYASSNTKGAPPGRLIVLLIDQGNIRTGAARAVMNSAKKFVDTLTPEDRVSVIAVPGPGEHVDFTTNHDRVREALLRITGQSSAIPSRFALSITEAMAIYMHSDAQLATEVINRECAQAVAAVDLERCQRDVEQDAGQIMSEVRRRTQDSVDGMRAVFKSLAGIEGPKSVVLVSEGLIFEGLGTETDDLALTAADSRATLDVLLLDVPQFDAATAQRPTTPREDRTKQVEGLEQLAGATRGGLYRINVTADYAFDRISRTLDGYYLLGVESRPSDRNGRRHNLGVKTTRRGVSLRSRRSFVTGISAKATSPEDAINRAIRSPLAVNDLPLKVSTWTYKEPGTNKIRVLIAAEAERLADQPLDYTVGVALVNTRGRGVAPAATKHTLKEKVGEPGTAVWTGMISVDPGEYRLLLALADNEGRVGSVSRAVTAWQMDPAAVSMGDLIVGTMDPSNKTALAPAIEPVINGGQMAALLEAYGTSLAGLEATLEILATENGAPLATMPMRVAAGSSAEIASASAQFSTTALPPGRYLARGTIRQGGKAQGHLMRPFRIVAEAAATDGGTVVPSAGVLPGAMAATLLSGLSAFDRKELLTPAVLTSAFAVAESRASGSKAAVKEARAGDLGAAAMTALGEGDQVLATFLKGLELYQQSQLDRAAMQFQNSMQMAPTFAPSRLFLGATLAEGNRHKEAAGLIQSAASASPSAAVARLAGEEWIKAGQPALAIAALELASQQPGADARTRKLLGIAYVLGSRPADAPNVLAPYLDANPSDASALLAAMFGTYIRHLNAVQGATISADSANMAKWSKAYASTKGPMQPLVGAWVKHVTGLK